MKNSIKILFALESYPPQITGSGISTMRLASGLAGRGHEVTVVCPGIDKGSTINIEKSVKVCRIKSFPIPFYREFRFSFMPQFSIKKVFRENQPDIIHLEDHLFVAQSVLAQARSRDLPVIATNHFTPYNWIPNLKIKNNSTLYTMIEKFLWRYCFNILKKVDIITVPSNFAREILLRAGLKKDALVISNGLKVEKFSKRNGGKYDKIMVKDENIFLLENGIDKKKVLILSVSRLDREKRIDLIIDALILVKSQTNMDFQFIVTGTGTEEKNLKKLSRDKGMENNIIFTGVVNENDLLTLYRASDIFISASEVELQGISIMEAMASGLPVVAANSTAIPELVIDGLNGYLFEPGNIQDASGKITALITDKKTREKMGNKSMILIKKHSFEKTLDSFEEIYFKCLNKTN